MNYFNFDLFSYERFFLHRILIFFGVQWRDFVQLAGKKKVGSLVLLDVDIVEVCFVRIVASQQLGPIDVLLAVDLIQDEYLTIFQS